MFIFSNFPISTLLIILSSVVTNSFPVNTNHNTKYHTRIYKLLHASRGSEFEGISELKKYFHRFGYLPRQGPNVTNQFDDEFKSTVEQYQTKLGLQVTGHLDFPTLSQILVPRCGAPDTDINPHVHRHFPGNPRWALHLPAMLTYAFPPKHTINHLKPTDINPNVRRHFSGNPRWPRHLRATLTYAFSPKHTINHLKPTDITPHVHRHFLHFPGNPRWARDLPATLTYAFSPKHTVNYLKPTDIKTTFKRAFDRWAKVVPIAFAETDDYGFSDIKIGFYGGDHGDGEPFDGELGILAHAFSPESGRFHLDAAERWSVSFEEERSKAAIDLESVATHEIGHLLGLGHSSVKEAVMYPSLRPRERKVDLRVDDVEGVQALYGTNPRFRFGSLSESETWENCGSGLRVGVCECVALLATLVISFLVFLF